VKHEVRAGPSLDGERLDRAIAALVPSISRNAARALIAAGRVFVDGKRVQVASRTVRADVRIVLHLDVEPSSPRPELRILFQDEDLLAIDKDPGQHVNETETSAELSLVEVVRAFAPKAVIVHRLDRGTSGVILLAKTAVAAAELSRAFREREVEKTYWAIAAGQVEDGEIDAPIGLDKRRPRARAVVASGQAAKTVVRTLSAAHGLSAIEARPITGRTHQIRVHLAHRGAPLVGDPLYGGPVVVRLQDALVRSDRVLLHARRLAITHRGRKLEIESPLPADMALFAPYGLGFTSAPGSA
jgi:23S rRNA pseudouridine1911/1915/1917 synthase